jgi:hypothetical protein
MIQISWFTYWLIYLMQIQKNDIEAKARLLENRERTLAVSHSAPDYILRTFVIFRLPFCSFYNFLSVIVSWWLG